MSGEHGEAFGAWLRRLRTAARLSQEELAERAGLTRNAISALERGERHHPYPHTVRALAAALGLSPEDRMALVDAARRPPLPSSGPGLPLDVPGATLPAPLTPLVGRERELEVVRELLLRPGHFCPTHRKGKSSQRL